MKLDKLKFLEYLFTRYSFHEVKVYKKEPYLILVVGMNYSFTLYDYYPNNHDVDYILQLFITGVKKIEFPDLEERI